MSIFQFCLFNFVNQSIYAFVIHFPRIPSHVFISILTNCFENLGYVQFKWHAFFVFRVQIQQKSSKRKENHCLEIGNLLALSEMTFCEKECDRYVYGIHHIIIYMYEY